MESMFTPFASRRLTNALPMSEIARMYNAYFAALEKQVVQFETVASKLRDDDKHAVLDIVDGLRREIMRLREQIDLFSKWGC